jgi:hypothetical protein
LFVTCITDLFTVHWTQHTDRQNTSFEVFTVVTVPVMAFGVVTAHDPIGRQKSLRELCSLHLQGWSAEITELAHYTGMLHGRGGVIQAHVRGQGNGALPRPMGNSERETGSFKSILVLLL